MIPQDWKLVWQDEFDDPAVDPSKWRVEVGYTGGSNAEWETYTDRSENVYVENSCLVIAAREEQYNGLNYTSARLHTQGLHAWTYGRFEARIQIPFGQGLWPAFWMLGEDIPLVNWPECGEIDIMEAIGKRPDMVRGTLHGPGYSRDDSVGMDFVVPGQRFADDFHRYAIEWEPDQIRFYVDDCHYNTLTRADVPGRWAFDHPFFMLINVAVGGFWPGYPDETTRFPQFMRVDYVRVYQRS